MVVIAIVIELFTAITVSTRSLGLLSELRNLGPSCTVILASDSQSVIDHSRRRGHSVASMHVGLRGLSVQEAIVDKKLTLEMVDTTVNPADVCTKVLLGDKIRELCRHAYVFPCHSEVAIGVDLGNWSLSGTLSSQVF